MITSSSSPATWLPRLFSFNRVEYFELDSEEDRRVPEVNFDTGTAPAPASAPAQAVSRTNAESPKQESGLQNQGRRIGF